MGFRRHRLFPGHLFWRGWNPDFQVHHWLQRCGVRNLLRTSPRRLAGSVQPARAGGDHVRGARLSPIRGHMYSLWFAALLLWLLERDRRGDRRWIPVWLLLFPLWVNLHGGFVVGIGFMAVYCLEQAVAGKPYRHLIGVAAAMGLLVAANPFGFSYYSYLWRALRMPRPSVPEWASVWSSFPSVSSVVFLVSLALVAYAVVTLRSRVIPGIGLILISAAEASMHQRMLPFLCRCICLLRAGIFGADAVRRMACG